MSDIIVCKFGGSSLATRAQVEKTLEIIAGDAQRRLIVVSAPGKKDKKDTKMTDYLLRIAGGKATGCDVESVKERIAEIGEGLGDVVAALHHELDARITTNSSIDYKDSIVAFGEYASMHLVAAIMRSKRMKSLAVDPAEIGFTAKADNGTVQPDPSCYPVMRKNILNMLSDGKTVGVMAGFYLRAPDGRVVVFPRGGSDISGAVAANAIDAKKYENWTDVDGLLMVDPALISDPRIVRIMTYEENRELTGVGGFKLERSTVVPLMDMYIPLHLKNTNNPSAQGTMVVCERIPEDDEYIVGVAHQENFSRLRLKKIGMDEEIGFGKKALEVLAERGIPYQHFPANTDIATLIIHENYLKGAVLQDVNRALRSRLGAEVIKDSNIDIVVAAGCGMGLPKHIDANTRIFGALSKAGIAQLVIDRSSPVSLTIGVPCGEGADAVKAIYREFYPSK